jgi:hypothetical protein
MTRRWLFVACSLSLLTACGGTTNPGAATGTGGSGSGTCASGSITFQVVPTAGASTVWCMGEAGSCTSNWLSIRDPNGNLLLSNFCSTPCDTCMMMACPDLCRVPSPLDASGLTQTWDGTYFTQGTCGTGTACLSSQCAPAGQYTAEICGFADTTSDAGFGCTGATSSAAMTCVQKPFEFPSSSTVVVTMPAQ